MTKISELCEKLHETPPELEDFLIAAEVVFNTMNIAPEVKIMRTAVWVAIIRKHEREKHAFDLVLSSDAPT